MAYLSVNVTGTTKTDLLGTITKATATGATQASASSTFAGDSTKLTGTIKSIIICNNNSSASATVALFFERFNTGSSATQMYILNRVSIPVGASLALDTPIEFDRSTDDLVMENEGGSDNVTIHVTYKLNKNIT
mgnify:CR=1 FL=1|jgi:hypothetical protein|tara:strand:+ start:272 stop:673 length:402 start_codon:yes stop_codon:yes gene_type:complete